MCLSNNIFIRNIIYTVVSLYITHNCSGQFSQFYFVTLTIGECFFLQSPFILQISSMLSLSPTHDVLAMIRHVDDLTIYSSIRLFASVSAFRLTSPSSRARRPDVALKASPRADVRARCVGPGRRHEPRGL